MDLIQDMVKKNIEFLEKYENVHNDLDKDCESFFKAIDNFINTGNMDFFRKSMIGKENAESVLLNTNKRKGRANKPVLADITEINVPTSSITIKKEKISDIPNISKNPDVNMGDININIKTEVKEMPAPTRLPPRKKKIKNEKVEVPLEKRSTRSRTRTKKLDLDLSNSQESNAKISSDVIIQDTTITTIEISDNEKDTETESEVEKNSYHLDSKSRTTRSKMKKRNKLNNCQEPIKQSLKNGVEDEKLNEISVANIKASHSKTNQKKRTRSDSVEEPSAQTDSKKSRSSSSTERECNGSVRTEYEDAVSVLEGDVDKNENNVTYVAASKNSKDDGEKAVQSSVNSTIIVENPKIKITKAPDQVDVQVKSSENKSDRTETASSESVKKTKGVKQVFSPYEKTPLKKKVEAFEKLGAITKIKKGTQKKDSKLRDNVFEEDEKQKFNEKPKALTPIMLKFQPKGCSTSRINKLHPNYINDKSVNNDSILSVKSASALKASQAEFRERETRRQEKEREALRKKEALLQAQTEEKRRKREEKQQKAQQQREMYEKEKQKQLEAHRLKEEKYKQAMAEKEEKLQKQKEEAEKKRMMVKKKATELKEKEEVMPELRSITEMKATLDKQGELAKLALRQKMERRQQQSVPLYMTTRPPLLPTDDCYDSDDPEYDRVRKSEPSWSRDDELRDQQMAMIVVGEQIKNSFFCRQAHTPDLQEIFELIDPRKLKRTSSAIWRKPPRYTLMPTNENTTLFSEESD